MDTIDCWVCGEELGDPDKEGTIGGDGYQMCLACDDEQREEEA